MKRIIKIGILLIFLTTIIFSTFKIALANDGDYRCRTTCQIEENHNESDPYWRQAPPEACNSGAGCVEDGKTQCCEELSKERYLASYGNYDMQDILTKAIKISNTLLGIVGSVALLFFIIAGIKMIFSGGSEEKIGSARTMMVQTVVGLVIFLSAYLIISFIQSTLLDEDSERYQLKEGSTYFENQ